MAGDVRGYVLLGVAAYLLGSFPIALILTIVFKRSDLRSVGSGNLGVYNTFFNVGKLPGLLAFAANGAVAGTSVLLARLFFPGDQIALLTAITAVTAGSMWQLFAGFRGSRGSSVLGWALLVSEPLICVALFGAWAVALLLRRRTTTATLILHLLTPAIFGMVAWSWSYAAAGGLLAVLLELRRRYSPDDTVALGLFRRFGINVDR